MTGKCEICGVEVDVFKIRPIREGEGSDWQPTVCRPCAMKLMPNPPRSLGQGIVAPEALETRPQPEPRKGDRVLDESPLEAWRRRHS